MTSYIATSDALEQHLEADVEWCRLSDLFHRMDGIYSRKLKDRNRIMIREREQKLTIDITWAASNKEICLVLMNGTESLQMPGQYLGSSQLSDAIRSGSAAPLNMSDEYAAWRKARLTFEKEGWDRWTERSAVVTTDATVQVANKPALDIGLATGRGERSERSPGADTHESKAKRPATGGGNRSYLDEGLVAEVLKDVKDGRAKSFLQAANERRDRIPGAGTPESKVKRIATKASKAAKQAHMG
jgi:hypothetical protein